MADMVPYIAIVEFPDGEHVLTGFNDSLHKARFHVDGIILNRRRAMFPDEKVQLKSIRIVKPEDHIAEVQKEKSRIEAAYPNRESLEDRWDTPSRLLSERVTDAPE